MGRNTKIIRKSSQTRNCVGSEFPLPPSGATPALDVPLLGRHLARLHDLVLERHQRVHVLQRVERLLRADLHPQARAEVVPVAVLHARVAQRWGIGCRGKKWGRFGKFVVKLEIRSLFNIGYVSCGVS